MASLRFLVIYDFQHLITSLSNDEKVPPMLPIDTTRGKSAAARVLPFIVVVERVFCFCSYHNPIRNS